MTKAPTLKVFGVNLDGTHRCIVAASSQKAAAEALHTSVNHLRAYGCVTGNKEEIAIAMQAPGVAWKKIDKHGAEWSELHTH